jgi:uncharacterized Zn-binding protein involved in type VI secretion
MMLLNIQDYMKPTNLLGQSYRGVVVDNADPDKLGRVKVTIAGLLEGDPANLPWISQRSAAMFGGQPEKGSFFAPSIDSELEIRFPTDDIYAGFYVGFWQTPETHNPVFDDGYPDKYGFIDDGFVVSYDNNKKEFIIEHPEGAKVIMKPDGSVEVTTDKNMKLAGKGGTELGDKSSITKVNGSKVIIADGGPPVARHGDKVVGGTASGGNLIECVVIATGKKVMAG